MRVRQNFLSVTGVEKKLNNMVIQYLPCVDLELFWVPVAMESIYSDFNFPHFILVIGKKKISKIRTSWSGLANSEISVPQFMPFDAIKSEDAYFAICDKVLSLVVAIYLLYNRTKPLFYFMIGLFKV